MRPILFQRHRSEQGNFDDGNGEVIEAILKAHGGAWGAWSVEQNL